MNFTITLPEGTENHGDPRLICTPANWRDLFVFYVTNYFIHAATLPTAPGESTSEILLSVLNALFVPGYGALRAVRRLVLRPGLQFNKSPLERAVASSALCMVVSDQSIEASKSRLPADSWTVRTFESYIDFLQCPPNRKIHGLCKLPERYFLCTVPAGAKLQGSGEALSAFEPSNEYNVVRVLFSLVQIVAGSVTIYRARGDQINQYGYGAFGLSVVPYVFMSSLNLIASLLGPDYPAMYLVRTPDMDEAKEKGGQFEGVVANLHIREPGDGVEKVEPWLCMSSASIAVQSWAVWIVSVLLPLAIVGGLSGGFKAGEDSTSAQRGWIMSWIVVGSASSLWVLCSQLLLRQLTEREDDVVFSFSSFLLISMPLWAPAIGGMVMVGQELRDFGVCTRFDLD